MNKKELKKEASKCDGCLGWLHHCKAECCKEFKMAKETLVKRRGGYITNITMNGALIPYLILHGVSITQDKKAFIETYKYKVIDEGTHLKFVRPCNALDENNLCTLHGTDKQPILCQAFDPCKPNDFGKRVYITPNCLANYKKE